MNNKCVDVAIIDYQMSNLHSVEAACKFVGLYPVVTSDPSEILGAKAAILPGVGAFGEAMSRIKELGLSKVIKDFIDSGRPFVGICLGLQLLFPWSEEFGSHCGLGIVGGRIERFSSVSDVSQKVLVPQVGWNTITQVNKGWGGTLLREVRNHEFMYFVHSYFVIPDRQDCTISETEYLGTRYCSALKIDNISAFQFHPERSGESGLEVYRSLRNELGAVSV